MSDELHELLEASTPTDVATVDYHRLARRGRRRRVGKPVGAAAIALIVAGTAWGAWRPTTTGPVIADRPPGVVDDASDGPRVVMPPPADLANPANLAWAEEFLAARDRDPLPGLSALDTAIMLAVGEHVRSQAPDAGSPCVLPTLEFDEAGNWWTAELRDYVTEHCGIIAPDLAEPAPGQTLFEALVEWHRDFAREHPEIFSMK